MSTPATPAEVERLKALRTTLAPEDGLKTAETFAKYLVASAATVGTVGTALKVAGGAELAGLGETLFVLAVGSLAISLAMAIWALVPEPIEHNPNQIASMEDALSRLLERRRRRLGVAGAFFAGALLLAGGAPLASSAHEDRAATGLQYTLTSDRTATATAQVHDGEALQPLTLQATEAPAGDRARRASARTFLDADGNGSVTAELKPRQGARAVRLVARFRNSDGDDEVVRMSLPLRQGGKR